MKTGMTWAGRAVRRQSMSSLHSPNNPNCSSRAKARSNNLPIVVTCCEGSDLITVIRPETFTYSVRKMALMFVMTQSKHTRTNVYPVHYFPVFINVR